LIAVEIVRKNPDQVGFAVNPRRWVVERFFAWIGHNRRLAKDFEATIDSARAFLYAASVILLVRAWRSFLAALFAEGASSDDLALYRACTGRDAWPTAAFSEAALIVGRRGGKSRILALIAVYLATMRDYSPYLAPGEVATIAVLAADRSQARVIFRFVTGLLKAVPLMQPMITGGDSETIALSNRVHIEIATASFRTARGYSFAAVLCDEVAFWRSDESAANPDVEILRALRPGLASIPGSMLLIASSPYAKRGELYNAYRKHYGRDDARVLVWKADTATMNPSIDPAIIAEAYESDPEAARAEYGGEFRDDLADFVTRETVDAVTMWGRSELPPQAGVAYSAFCDPSGGLVDAMSWRSGISAAATCACWMRSWKRARRLTQSRRWRNAPCCSDVMAFRRWLAITMRASGRGRGSPSTGSSSSRARGRRARSTAICCRS
jgi:hypothetical protein